MITLSNPKVEPAEDGLGIVFYADFFNKSDSGSENAAVAGTIIEKIANQHPDYRHVPSDDLGSERELIPTEVAQKPGNPIKSVMVLNAFDHPELNEDYGRGCLRVVCSAPGVLKDILSQIPDLSHGDASAELDKAFAGAPVSETGDEAGSRDRLLPANFKKKAERLILRQVNYDDPAGQPQAVFMALTMNQDAEFAALGNPAAAVEQFAGAVVHRVTGRVVSDQDRQIAMDSFRAAAAARHAGIPAR